MPSVMTKGTLAFWIPDKQRRGNKHWVIVSKRLRRKKLFYYVVTDGTGMTVTGESLVPATIEQVIRYNRRRWGDSAKRTRRALECAKLLV